MGARLYTDICNKNKLKGMVGSRVKYPKLLGNNDQRGHWHFNWKPMPLF